MNRYPPLDNQCVEPLILDKDRVASSLGELYRVFAKHRPDLEEAVDALKNNKDPESLRALCDIIFQLIPMYDTDNVLMPLHTTQQQISKFLSGEPVDLGDCKLLTIFATYICTVLCSLPIVVSIRNYSEHPVLYIDLNGITHKISFLHVKTKVEPFTDDNPFALTPEESATTAFTDYEFRNTMSILYWRVRDAIFVLDCMNLLRRCVVNYVFEPEKYGGIFSNIVQILNDSGIFQDSILFYWQEELVRIQYMYSFRKSELLTDEDKEIFRKDVINSLRFQD